MEKPQVSLINFLNHSNLSPFNEGFNTILTILEMTGIWPYMNDFLLTQPWKKAGRQLDKWVTGGSVTECQNFQVIKK